MADHAKSDSPAVQAQLDRLSQLSSGRDILGLERITALLDALGNPERRLPPVFHVAGTNGKGSTCAFLRAALEADNKLVHCYTSPHLVRFNERIRIHGKLIGDDMLADYLRRVLDIAEPIAPSFFEATTAAAFLAFAEHPADAAVIEVGLGGRLDATNVIPTPVCCGIAQLGLDHEAFLSDDAVQIAREKAGIAKPGRPLVTMAYPLALREAVAETAEAADATVRREGYDWHYTRMENSIRIVFEDKLIDAQLPALSGAHQFANAALAIAMLLAQQTVSIRPESLEAAPARAIWPARLQRLVPGPLTADLGARIMLLDGGHNVAAAKALANHLSGQSRHLLILGMMANKDAGGWLDVMAPHIAGMIAVPIADHAHHAPQALVALAEARGIPAATAPDISSAVALAAQMPDDLGAVPVLIAGSLYLAGEVLRLNGQAPD
ncbi:MAG: bifunctional folylpolyglutamate synthase/dihydrofolate synthase [Sphingopyxis sp.]